jgi:endonuclease/exonuclease/phosphatase family metal-dependent hydrolase
MTALPVMTWNVRYFGHGTYGMVATHAWMDSIAAALAALQPRPALIALQEVETTSLRAGGGSTPQLERFLRLLEHHGAPYQARYFPAHRYGPLYSTGLAILAAPELCIETTTMCEVTHHRVPLLAPLKQARLVAHARVRTPCGTTIDLFNTHLSLPAFFEVGPHRVPDQMGSGSNQVHEIHRALEFMGRKARATHTLVMGDLNSRPASPVHNALQAAGLVDAFAQHRPGPWATARFAHKRMHIDHVFCSPHTRFSGFEDHHIDGEGPLIGLSDHAPKVGHLLL